MVIEVMYSGYCYRRHVWSFKLISYVKIALVCPTLGHRGSQSFDSIDWISLIELG